MDLKFNQIDSRMGNKSKVQNVWYKMIISILCTAFECFIRCIYTLQVCYTLNLGMIKCSLYIFPHNLILYQIIYHFILLMLTDIIGIVVTSHKLIIVCSNQNQLWTKTAQSNIISTSNSEWTQFVHSSRSSRQLAGYRTDCICHSFNVATSQYY